MTASVFTEEAMLARLHELCAQRDATYAKNAPLEAALEKANLEAEKYRLQAAAIAAEIDENFGGEAWLALKKEIKVLTLALGHKAGNTNPQR